MTNHLKNITIVSFESRMAEAVEKGMEKLGANLISAPSMREVPFEQHQNVFDSYEKIKKGEFDYLVLMTGVGMKFILSVLEKKYLKEELVEVFSQIPIICRGPKPVSVLNQWGIPYALVAPEPNTWKELLEVWVKKKENHPIKNKKILMQEYGKSNEVLETELEKLGASVTTLPIYRWDLPEDLSGLRYAINAIIKEEVHLLFFTSAKQIEHVFEVAKRKECLEELKIKMEKVAICSVGPVTTEALKDQGLQVAFEPSRPKLGIMMKEISDNIQEILK